MPVQFPRPGPAPQLGPDVFAARRRTLATLIGKGECMLVATHAEAVFAHDVHYPYRPNSDFWYLTGFAEPGAVILIEGGTGRTTMWLRPRDAKKEIWDGHRVGVERATRVLGVDEARDILGLARTLPDAVAGRRVHAILDHDVGLRARIKRAIGKDLTDGRPYVAQMRMIKGPDEVRMLRRACRVGMDAMRQAATLVHPGSTEHAIEGALIGHYRSAGSQGWGYPPIVGAGANAAVLHYVANTGPVRKGDLVLIDAGCSWGYYTCDITRTFPASGRMDETQAPIYDLVEEARRKAVAKVRPGNRLREPHDEACRVITEGLVDLGYLKGRPEDLVREGAYRAFFMHGTSHFLGLDVHDAGSYKDEDGLPIRLQEGMVITIEPGLYFNAGYAKVPRGTKGIGVRLEDDVLVTSSGRSVLTSALPTARDAVEALCAGKP